MEKVSDSIERHKQQIQKRIGELQQRFKKQYPREQPKRNNYVDENKLYSNQIGLSKTMEIKPKGRSDFARLKKNVVAIGSKENEEIHKQAKAEYTYIDTIKQKAQKEQKIRQLQYMVKSLLEGQKVLEKELNEIKIKQKVDDSNQFRALEDSFNRTYQQPIHLPQNKQKSPQKAKQNSVIKKKGSSNMINQSLLFAENNSLQKGHSHQKKASKKTYSINSKKKQFQQLYHQLRSKQKPNQRIIIRQQWKSKLWNEVQHRIRQSDKQYKDTIHRNNKHEVDHLMSTYELQRKLKDDLIGKVYQQCNDQIYK